MTTRPFPLGTPARPRAVLTPACAALLLAAVWATPALAQPLPVPLEDPTPSPLALFGRAVARVPDATGDGVADLLVGAPDEDVTVGTTTYNEGGYAYLLDGATGAAVLTLRSPNVEISGEFGVSVAGLPDVNGNGRGDLLIGAHFEEVNGQFNAGRAYVFDGGTGALLHTVVSSLPQPRGWFGLHVAEVPDLDGDGRSELFVGSSGEDAVVNGTTYSDAGRAHVFSGRTGTYLGTLVSPNPVEGGYFGRMVAGVRYADNDRRGDLLVGGPQENSGAVRSGRAYLFSGRRGRLVHALVPPDPELGGLFGRAVSGTPDVDGDGRGDLLVGAIYEDAVVGATTYREAGGAHLFSGRTGALLLTLQSPDPDVQGFFGRTLIGVPDVNGDGRGDLLVGAPAEDVGGIADTGRAYLFDGVTGALLRTLDSPAPEDMSSFGLALAVADDWNGDGSDDLFVGAPGETVTAGGTPIIRAGRAYVLSGAPETVSPVPLAALTGVPLEATPAARLGITAVAPNPARGQARIAWAKPTAGPVRLSVYDALGREVAVLADGALGAGQHEAVLDAARLAPGVYVARLRAGSESAVQRIVVAR